MSIDDRRSNPLLQADIADLNMRGMADCMDMVRSELIEAAIIDKSVPPMMVANAVLAHVMELKQDYNFAVDSVAALSGEVEDLQTRLVAIQAEAQRFAACRHAARTMPEDGGEDAFIEAIDKYIAEHGI